MSNALYGGEKMLKLNGNPIKKRISLRLPEDWHEKVLDFSKKEKFPYEFYIIDTVKKGRINYCICSAQKSKDDKLVLSEYAVKYLLAEEIQDSNEGLSFKEFFPEEDSQIIMTNIRNPNVVIPAIFKIRPEQVELNNVKYVCMDFVLDYINGEGFTSISYYCLKNKKYTWKLIEHPDQSYMTDYERMFCETIIHRRFVEKSCAKLISYLEREEAFNHANALRKRAKEHDLSKIKCEDEMRALSLIINDQESLRDASKHLSQIQKDAIKLHWKHNSHHPEHFKSPIDMEKIDVMEMCCDWHARSCQKDTDFLEFVKERQENRFHFPEWMFAEIWHYCQVLNSP